LDLEKFRDDVYELTEKLSRHLPENDIPKLNPVRQRLIETYQENLVKNQSLGSRTYLCI